MRSLPLALLLTAILCLAPIAGAQASEAPVFTVGDMRLYAHATADSMTVWMDPVEAEGTVTYYLTGAPTSSTGLAMDPVANQAFTARIPLTPGLAQDIVIGGTVTVQAYIGGGAASAGVANIGTSLAIDGEAVASAAAKQHTMTPQAQAGTTYNAISWTMTVSETAVAAGALVEWVISGTITAGNNIYLSAGSGRGSSYIELPVVSVAAALPDITYEDLDFPVSLAHDFAEATSGAHVFNWTSPGGALEMRVDVVATQGFASLQVVVDGQAAYAANVTESAVVPLTVVAGPGTIFIDYRDFAGNLSLAILPAPPQETDEPMDLPDNGAVDETGNGTGNETIDAAGDAKDTPVPWVVPVVGVLLAAARRRR